VARVSAQNRVQEQSLERENHDSAAWRPSIQAQQFGAMVTLIAHEQQLFLFYRRDVTVAAAKRGASVNDVDGEFIIIPQHFLDFARLLRLVMRDLAALSRSTPL
jgi:hypothetical protein